MKKDLPSQQILVYEILLNLEDTEREIDIFHSFSFNFSLSPIANLIFSTSMLFCMHAGEGERKSYFAVVKKLKESEEKRAFTNTQNAIF